MNASWLSVLCGTVLSVIPGLAQGVTRPKPPAAAPATKPAGDWAWLGGPVETLRGPLVAAPPQIAPPPPPGSLRLTPRENMVLQKAHYDAPWMTDELKTAVLLGVGHPIDEEGERHVAAIKQELPKSLTAVQKDMPKIQKAGWAVISAEAEVAAAGAQLARALQRANKPLAGLPEVAAPPGSLQLLSQKAGMVLARGRKTPVKDPYVRALMSGFERRSASPDAYRAWEGSDFAVKATPSKRTTPEQDVREAKRAVAEAEQHRDAVRNQLTQNVLLSKNVVRFAIDVETNP